MVWCGFETIDKYQIRIIRDRLKNVCKIQTKIEVGLNLPYCIFSNAVSNMALGIASAGNSFASDVSKALFSGNGNVFFSPWSLFDCLVMLHVGSRKNTAKQLSTVLRFQNLGPNMAESPTAIYEAMKNLIESLSGIKSSETDFATSSKVWLQPGFEIIEKFTNILKDLFLTRPETVDFVNSPEDARLAINRWVEEMTNYKIKDLIPDGSLTKETKLVLTNAVYFKGSWRHAFDPLWTQVSKFRLCNDETVDAEMMYMKVDGGTRDVRYYCTSEYQVLGLPYTGGRLTMNIVLPNTPNGIKNILESMTNDTTLISQLIKADINNRIEPIEVYIPKFKIDFSTELNGLLSSLGAEDMFDWRADFSGISTEETLDVDSVIQKAFISVDEEGTEAAAATAVMMRGLRCAMPDFDPIVVRADHPFLFFISDISTNTVVFMGKIDNPN